MKEVDLQSWFQDEDGSWKSVKVVAQVVSPEGGLQVSAFGQAGDSGSFVFDKGGRFAGLYMGGNAGEGTGYVMAADDLFEDI
jgi:hypothetical protein